MGNERSSAANARSGVWRSGGAPPAAGRAVLREGYGAKGLHSIFAHELIHWLRLMPYKLSKDKKRAPMFYAGLVMVANDLDTWNREGWQ